jgi:hypothetical protein
MACGQPMAAPPPPPAPEPSDDDHGRWLPPAPEAPAAPSSGAGESPWAAGAPDAVELSGREPSVWSAPNVAPSGAGHDSAPPPLPSAPSWAPDTGVVDLEPSPSPSAQPDEASPTPAVDQDPSGQASVTDLDDLTSAEVWLESGEPVVPGSLPVSGSLDDVHEGDDLDELWGDDPDDDSSSGPSESQRSEPSEPVAAAEPGWAAPTMPVEPPDDMPEDASEGVSHDDHTVAYQEGGPPSGAPSAGPDDTAYWTPLDSTGAPDHGTASPATPSDLPAGAGPIDGVDSPDVSSAGAHSYDTAGDGSSGDDRFLVGSTSEDASTYGPSGSWAAGGDVAADGGASDDGAGPDDRDIDGQAPAGDPWVGDGRDGDSDGGDRPSHPRIDSDSLARPSSLPPQPGEWSASEADEQPSTDDGDRSGAGALAESGVVRPAPDDVGSPRSLPSDGSAPDLAMPPPPVYGSAPPVPAYGSTPPPMPSYDAAPPSEPPSPPSAPSMYGDSAPPPPPAPASSAYAPTSYAPPGAPATPPDQSGYGQPAYPQAPAAPANADPSSIGSALQRISPAARAAAKGALTLTAHLISGQRVESLVIGRYQGAVAVAVLTDQQLLLVNDHEWQPVVEKMAVDGSLQVQGWDTGATVAMIFTSVGRPMELESIPDKQVAYEFAARIQARTGAQ